MQVFLNEYGSIITWLGIISTCTFFLSLLIIPWGICKLDTNYFLHLHEHTKKEDEHPVIFILLKSLRNFLGTLLLLAGILMIFLPGQGVLTMVLGITCWIFLEKEH